MKEINNRSEKTALAILNSFFCLVPACESKK